MADDLVSVIVPTYNRAYCVGRAIDSVRAQSHSNWELIIVDDGSSDNTADLVSANYGADSRVSYIRQANAGVSAARNTGIAAARGNYIALLDSDDAWKSWKLEVQLACFHAFPEIGMAWTDFEAVDSTGKVASARYLRTMYEAYRFYPTPESLFTDSCELSSIADIGRGLESKVRAYVGDIYAAMLRGNLVHTSTVMLSRERMNKVEGFDVGLALSGEDYDFHFRTCKYGRVCFVDAPSTIYQLEYEDRLTRHKLRIAENFLRTIQKALDREKDSNQFPPQTVREVLTEAHGWIAGEMYYAGNYSGARYHALKSLRLTSWQPSLFKLLAISSMPRAIIDPLLNTYRRSKGTLRPAS